MAVFYMLAVIMIPLAFGVIFDRSIIRSGFILIGVFGAISGIFLILEAQFLAMAQIMIYAVGITLVVVIALMLTNPKMEEEKSTVLPDNKWSAFFVSVIVFATIYMSLRSVAWNISPMQIQTGANVKTLGWLLMTAYSLPFEFASVLLLAALIGAVMLAKAEPIPAVKKKDNPANLDTAKRTENVIKV
jgi:NADH:ubiquinone oxidoreductase subunit 6 (subunit J)